MENIRYPAKLNRTAAPLYDHTQPAGGRANLPPHLLYKTTSPFATPQPPPKFDAARPIRHNPTNANPTPNPRQKIQPAAEGQQ